MSREFHLNQPETLFLAGYLRRLTQWDPFAAVRIEGEGNALGFYSDVDDSFIAFIALPTSAVLTEPLSSVVSAGRLRDVIGDVRARSGSTGITVPDEVDASPTLQNLPPRQGWQPAFKGMAGDITAEIDAQIERASAQAELLPERAREAAMRADWAQPGWSSLPRGVLHIARQLGFLNLAQTPVAASTNGPWKRITTAMGQVFARADDGIARLSVVRGK